MDNEYWKIESGKLKVENENSRFMIHVQQIN